MYNYVPILKAKDGELIALRNLNLQAKVNLTPLVELQIRETPSLLQRTISQIERAWQPQLPLLLDVDKQLLVNDAVSAIGNLGIALNQLSAKRFNVIPVTGLRRPNAFNNMISTKTKNGICVRLQSSDWQNVSNLEKNLKDFVQSISLPPNQVDIVLDYEAFLPSYLGTVITSAVTAINSISSIVQYRSLIMTATAFPSHSIAQPHTIYRFPRSEFHAWSVLINLPNIRRKPVFGDYTTVHPVLPDIDFSYGIKVAPKIKYATDSEWLCLRWDAGDFADFQKVCTTLAGLPEFAGSNYSWGDQRIAQCTTTRANTGNPREWVSIGVNHHLTLVAAQCASHPVV